MLRTYYMLYSHKFLQQNPRLHWPVEAKFATLACYTCATCKTIRSSEPRFSGCSSIFPRTTSIQSSPRISSAEDLLMNRLAVQEVEALVQYLRDIGLSATNALRDVTTGRWRNDWPMHRVAVANRKANASCSQTSVVTNSN